MPLLAEIADKMPTLATLWERWLLVGVLLGAVTLGLSLVRLWIGAVVVVLGGCLGVLAAWPDTIFDPDIIAELGSGYLFQQRLSGFVPLGLAFIVWAVVAAVRWHTQTAQGNGAMVKTQTPRSPRRAKESSK